MATRHLLPSLLHHRFIKPPSPISSCSSLPLRLLNLNSSPRSRRTRNKTLTFSTSSMASSTAPPTPKKVLVPIADGTEPMEAVITIVVLRRSGADVTVASVEKDRLCVDACWGVKIVADSLVSEAADAQFDLVALPGGMPGSANLRDCEVLERIVRRHVDGGGLYSAVCAAPAVALGSWGLLKGLRATCYPSFMEKLPSDSVPVETRVVQDGRVITSRGAGTAIEFGLALVEQLYGKDKAEEVGGAMVLRPRHGDEFSMTELNSIEWKASNPPQVLVPIANGSEEMEAIMIIDILRRASVNVTVVSVEDKLEIVASRKVKLLADVLIDEAATMQYDLIILPGGILGAQTFSSSEVLLNMLKKQAESNKLYGAVCASPALVLEPHGLLQGKKATAYPALCSKLSDQSEAENRVVVDGNLVTSRGPGTSVEFSLAVVEKLYGRKKALDLAKSLIFV